MAKFEIVIPKMGEGVLEATVLSWLKKVGEEIEEDETLLEIATDKVDSDVPSPVKGRLLEILAEVNEVVEVGKVVAILETEAEEVDSLPVQTEPIKTEQPENLGKIATQTSLAKKVDPINTSTVSDKKIYSPLVRSIAKEEKISLKELDKVRGSGAHGRVTKKDILAYLEVRKPEISVPPIPLPSKEDASLLPKLPAHKNGPAVQNGNHVPNLGEEIIEMDRMRQLIADHMVMSKHTSPHVTCFLEVDVTDMVAWRTKQKAIFQEKYGEKLTFTPLFVQAVSKAIQDFPLINVSVDGNKIIRKKQVNIGMATALPSGNLIVPVIKHADRMNLMGLAAAVNDLAGRARNNKLKPDEIQGGTFTVSNLGAFRIDAGTPIINQPQVAILALGNIVKKPAVVTTDIGDVIAIRQKMMLSLSFDHRVVDGYLGGSFLRRVGDYIEGFHLQAEAKV
ncbi:MAG: dihydrolipoamide acetyltransferase family protein [Bacteroidota bacterium]